MGGEDTQTAIQAAPFGIDSNPVPDLIAVYAQTSEAGRTVLIGYLNKEQVAAVGETRLFATDANGNEQVKGYIHLKNDETIEIGGNTDNMIRFSPLDSALQGLIVDLQAELVLIAAGIATGGGAYSPGILNLDISASKIEETKTH
ncbi:MAG: hypothetical protein IMY67_11305 [Bacteroidetes bacterium]|nr:hypothetical protein [Bacteroidota bacterium]